MKILKQIYKVARSVLFSVIIFIAALYLILYILLSVPSVQNDLRSIAEREISKYIGGKVSIENLTIRPFNEAIVKGLEAYTPSGELCLRVETVGAGVNIWRILKGEGIEITYGEIIGLDAKLWQEHEDSALNIQYIVDAFKTKDKNKPPAKFDINLRNVVLRRCAVSFDKRWVPFDSLINKTDYNHLKITDLKADVTFPELKNDDFNIDLRRLSFKMSGGLDVIKLAFRAHVTSRSISLEDFILTLPASEFRPADIVLKFDGFDKIKDALAKGDHRVVFVDNQVSLSDFGWLLPELRIYPQPIEFSLNLAGNMRGVKLNGLSVASGEDLSLEVSGEATGLDDIKNAEFLLENLKIGVSGDGVNEIISGIPSLGADIKGMLSNLGAVGMVCSGKGAIGSGDYEIDSHLTSACGEVVISGETAGLKGRSGYLRGEVSTEGFDVGTLIGNGKIGNLQATVNLDGNLRGKDIDGDLDLYVPEMEFNGVAYSGVTAAVVKEGKDIYGDISIDDKTAKIVAELTAHVDGEYSWLGVQCDIDYFSPSQFGLLPKYDGYVFKGGLSAELEGDNADNVKGEIRLTDLSFLNESNRGINLDRLIIKAEDDEDGRRVSLSSDFLDGEVTGSFKVADLPKEIMLMASSVLPSLVVAPDGAEILTSDVEFSFLVKPDNSIPEFFNLPFRLLVPIPIEGEVRGTDQSASLAIDIPYLLQGKNKLLRDNRLTVELDGLKKTVNGEISTTFPVKKGELAVNMTLLGQEDKVFADIDWINTENSNFKGLLSLGALLSKNGLSSKPEITLDINPSIFNMGSAKWNIDKGNISYADNILNVEGLKIWHDNQFVEIEGTASALPTDTVTVKLADIDFDYVFETLNINYVTFGGTATGELMASGAFSKDPVALTDGLNVKQLAYNGAVLGDAVIKSRWNNAEKEVEINADIREDGVPRAKIDGGIWVTRDSLSFAIDANRVRVGFLAPFMAAFSSDVKGYASGNAKLFGTFSDIDLTGRILGDSIALKLDYTNTYYHGTDSVILNPGRIVIPSFRLYDRNGNSAVLSGELTHRYFHDPSFNFRISDARRFLCYDTNQKMNPDWYGTVYGDGSAVVKGWPGTVSVSVDMNVVNRSAFTFVLNDTEAAADYHFLTFSDRRKEEMERFVTDSVPDVIAAFRKKVEKSVDTPTRFMMDIRCSVSPSALLTLVMDPAAGDKITARGNGAIQIDYESDSDEMQMFGKYTLDEGNYNFSLQDLILRDFNIRPGSSISFNGDPLNALLDITASYRVNTNLTDLDKSFATDRELARTNVPVDAVLMVKGDMQQPDITFDIELPTLTQDVARKVKSIISTDDMMSRQIIYLLALSRFYTPEYMGSTSNGGELAAVASTTLSSQLQNMLGQLTDKFTLAPSFRSDKGDFSDLEVDVALSSRLLNNRLLVNGNFGYRDKSTSTTTFVGDFDIEYLLSRNGNLRLKAYNHFNDQNYYLREALTTQGLGVVYRRDFNNPFTFLKRRKKETEDESGNKTDSVPVTIPNTSKEERKNL